MHVLDIGGEAQFWRQRELGPAQVTMVYVIAEDVAEPWIKSVVGNGCALPVEPHFLVPFFQHLPRSAQASVAARWPVGNFGPARDLDVAFGYALEIELLPRAEMRRYFPDAELLAGKVAGLTKSWIAVRRP